jgi:hypothetical protein
MRCASFGRPIFVCTVTFRTPNEKRKQAFHFLKNTLTIKIGENMSCIVIYAVEKKKKKRNAAQMSRNAMRRT